ncbi:class V chitinase Chi100 [Nemania abortiva]|nr:class V chitinase Chi100 [Nemania abortiva]
MRILLLSIAIFLAVLRGCPGASAVASDANNEANALMASIGVRKASSPVSGMPTDVASARAAVLAGNYTTRLHHQGRDRCPSGCTSAGTDSSAWYVYGGLKSVDMACNKTMLLDFALFNPVDGPKSHIPISACTADLVSPAIEKSIQSSDHLTACVTEKTQQTRVTASLQLATSGDSTSAHISDITTALYQLQAFSALSDSGCNETIKYAYSRNVALGIYAGSGLAHQGLLESVLAMLGTQMQSQGSVPETLLVQLCSNSSTRYSLGVIASAKGDLGAIQRGLQSMKNGSCLISDTTTTRATDWKQVTYLAPSLLHSNGSTTKASGTNSTNLLSRSLRNSNSLIASRDDSCSTVQVVFGDSCASLAAECGITPAQFTEYNPDPSLCGSLTPGQHVCCSAGTLPDFTPKPDQDGYCYVYLVRQDDSCSSIGAAHSITNDQIMEFNKDTWGWNGCGKLFADYNICLSSGYPPMPAIVPNAVCGPQVNGTAKAPPGTDLSTLNQCPLNACCDIFGQCGTTTEFCTPSNSSTGAPGTAAPGENGCISNCGTDIIVSSAPSETYNIAYFEAFDWQRPCLKMSVTDIDTSLYTHIHFSFVTFNEDFTINTDDISDQLALFRGMMGVKKIVSIGGWTFSTDPSSYTIFRNAVASEVNRQTLVTNFVNFLNDYDIDGIDWDWEYPDEPDIPGIPAGTEADATGYFLLLDELKQKMPEGKTVSVTAPASFWYLQHFPIQAISLVVDYLVYLTYDLHGQWDYTNKYSDPGCVSYDQGLGNCLRSHVNLTETINALSMITKAGVPSNMIAVGVSSYGRSFQMTTPNCWTEQCTYTGPDSGAYPGLCTTTPGYLADYEIGLILRQNPTAQSHFDSSSYSNIVVFNDTQWVAYMDADNKATRKALYPGLSFLGTADWAVDLQSETGGFGSGSGHGNSSNQTVYIDPAIWSSVAPLVTAPPGVTLVWPPMPLASPTTITFPPWTTTVSYSSLTTTTTTRGDGVITTEPHLVWVSWLTVLTIPPVTTTAIPVWGVIIDPSATDGEITLTSSVQPPPFTVIVTPTLSGTTSIIGATETSTSSGDPVIWGTMTWIPPVQTETLGGHTTIIGGQALPPAAITVTPNPHPTTTPKPGTTDPVLNSHKPSWTSGASAHPTVSPGCIGCGSPCILFCDPGCPFCPPGVFGPHSGGGSSGDPDNNDDDDDDDDDDDGDDAAYTVMFDELNDESFPTAYVADDALTSIYSNAISRVSSAFGISSTTTTTTTTRPTTTTTQPPPPPPTPHADCAFFDEILFWTFEVYNIENWVTDGGSSLHHEESGCGALTGWDFHAEDSEYYAYVFFNLPFFIKDGCVERAIVSAGGPKISCKGASAFDSKRDVRLLDSRASRMNLTAPVDPPYTPEQLTEFNAFYKDMQPTVADHSYVPMVWSSTVPITTTPLTTASATLLSSNKKLK